jgi:hypothetical protein
MGKMQSFEMLQQVVHTGTTLQHEITVIHVAVVRTGHTYVRAHTQGRTIFLYAQEDGSSTSLLKVKGKGLPITGHKGPEGE